MAPAARLTSVWAAMLGLRCRPRLAMAECACTAQPDQPDHGHRVGTRAFSRRYIRGLNPANHCLYHFRCVWRDLQCVSRRFVAPPPPQHAPESPEDWTTGSSLEDYVVRTSKSLWFVNSTLDKISHCCVSGQNNLHKNCYATRSDSEPVSDVCANCDEDISDQSLETRKADRYAFRQRTLKDTGPHAPQCSGTGLPPQGRQLDARSRAIPACIYKCHRRKRPRT